MKISEIVSSQKSVRVYKANQLSDVEVLELEKLISSATKDPHIGGDWLLTKLSDHAKLNVIARNGSLIGFFNPRLEKGYWRSGAVYILPKYRGQGIMFEVLKDFFASHMPARSWIADENRSSIKLYKKLGFLQGEKYNISDAPEDQGFWYIKSH